MLEANELAEYLADPSISAGQKRIFGVDSSFDMQRNTWYRYCGPALQPEAPPASLAAVVVPPPATFMGLLPSLSIAQVRKARPTCLRLLVQLMRWAFALARARAGSNRAAKMAMMAITTNNSIRVKAPIFLRRFFINYAGFYFCFGKQTANFTSAVHAVNPNCLFLKQ